MEELDQLLLQTGGVQTRWEIEAERPPPDSFEELSNGVLRERARDAWRAACRLQSLVYLWMRFLTLGMLHSRLDADVERKISERFPDLSGMGSLLEGLARTIAWPAGVLDLLKEWDRSGELRREPNSLHTTDGKSSLFKLQDFENFRNCFRRLVKTDALCLCLLQVNVPQFRKSKAEIEQEIDHLFALDQDWATEPPVIHFGPALQKGSFRRALAFLRSGAKDLLELLAAHPGTALDRPGKEESGPGRKPRGSMPKKEANVLVRDYLEKHPVAKSREIAEKIACSDATVRKTPAWRIVSNERNKRKYTERAGDYSDSTIERASQKIAEERHSDAKINAEVLEAQKHDNEKPSQETGRRDGGEELAKLVAEQAKEESKDKRRPRRKRSD